MPAPGHRLRVIAAILVATGTLHAACFIFQTEEDRYRINIKNTMRESRSFANIWNLAGLQKLHSGSDWKNELTQLLSDIDFHGLEWSTRGEAISYEEVTAKINREKVRYHLPSTDGWGNHYEFKIIKGFLAVRSFGADGTPDTDMYFTGSFEWLSGGDLIVVGGEDVRAPMFPCEKDWLREGF